MLIKLQTSIKADGNKGSSYALATYLEKYDVEKEQELLSKRELPSARDGFFNHNQDGLSKSEVVYAIDSNKKGLGKNDCKFYAITIAPSQNELNHLLYSICKKPISQINELTKLQLIQFENELKNYTKAIMNVYAAHFKRKGLINGSQLVYAGKVEHYREYKGTDIQVKNGLKKVGDKKPGLNSHIHVIISRKDKDMKFKLSPLANEKGFEKNSMLNGKKVQRGFDRTLFSIKSEETFDSMYNYNRKIEDQVIYKIEASKNNDIAIGLEQNASLKEKLKHELVLNFIKSNNYGKEVKTKNYSTNTPHPKPAINPSEILISDIDKKRKKRKRKL